MAESYRKKFYDIYSKINNDLLILDETRKQIIRNYLKENKTQIVMIAIIFILESVNLFLLATKNLDYNIFMAFLIFPLFVLRILLDDLFPKYDNIKSKYKQEIKPLVLKNLIKAFGDMEYVRQVYPINTSIYKSGLILDDELFIIDDQFKGSYKNINYEIIERKNLYYYTNEVFICIEANKKVNEKTIIESNSDVNSGNKHFVRNLIMGMFYTFVVFWVVFIIKHILVIPFAIFVLWFGIKYISSAISNRKQMSKINTEDLGFDKRFCVYSKDQIEARYLVTPAFMERLKNLQTAFGTKNIKCSFVDDKIMFAISTKKDLFEVGNIFTPLTNSKHINEFYNQITSVFEMIDYFKLDQKTGL